MVHRIASLSGQDKQASVHPEKIDSKNRSKLVGCKFCFYFVMHASIPPRVKVIFRLSFLLLIPPLVTSSLLSVSSPAAFGISYRMCAEARRGNLIKAKSASGSALRVGLDRINRPRLLAGTNFRIENWANERKCQCWSG